MYLTSHSLSSKKSVGICITTISQIILFYTILFNTYIETPSVSVNNLRL